jgi:transcription antitermination factor NusG
MDNEIYNSPADLQWYAVWTRSRQEKCAASVLETLGIPHFLPLKTEVHQWSDRKQTVTVPLFSGYVFVRVDLAKRSRLDVLNASGVVGFVGNQMGPLPIPDHQIEDIRVVLETRIQYTVLPLLNEGDRVRVLRGPLTGIEGRLVPCNSSSRLSISIEMIHKSLLVSVSRDDVELIEHPGIHSLLHSSRNYSSAVHNMRS